MQLRTARAPDPIAIGEISQDIGLRPESASVTFARGNLDDDRRAAVVAAPLAIGRDIFFISITVDPQHDTPEMLKAFGDGFDAGPGWHFVT